MIEQKAYNIQIKQARQALGLSQQKVADLSYINLRNYQKIEAGVNFPRRDTLNNICKALNLNIIFPDSE